MQICPLCKSLTQKEMFSFKGHIYFKCDHCSLVFLDVNATSRAADIYTEDYIKGRGHDEQGDFITQAKETTAAYYLSMAEKHIQPGNLLEIGCSTGIFLKVAQKRGWKIHGVEINQDAAAVARKTLGVDTIFSTGLSKGMFPEGSFSMVVLFDVIEHIQDPVPFMEDLVSLIRPGGYILFLTPDMNSLSARFLKSKWPHTMLEHVCLYSARSMKVLLRPVQLRQVRAGWGVKYVNVGMLRRHLECHPHIFLSKPAHMILRSLSFLNKITFPFNIGEMLVLAQKPLTKV
jgi:2-polyprenyl-3-methyl-5-hydroxy-6-metoxy-1,4-benzoquinol methylase